MRISGLQKTTLQDFPGCIAAIVFTQGCNYRCAFCQNSGLLDHSKEPICEEKVLNYIIKRKNILEGVVISGGEPTIQPGLKKFIIKIKENGLKVKLDTNGTNPTILKELTEEKLLDYIAMDIKNVFDKYSAITGVEDAKIDNIKKSIKIIKDSLIDHEFRTTIVKGYHREEDIEEIIKYIGDSKFFIQNFENSENVLCDGLQGFSDVELKSMNERLRKKFTNVQVRGL